MPTMSPKEIKLMREILHILNDAYPPGAIPITIWQNDRQVKTVTTQDQHFNAFKDYGVPKWWISCNDYSRWQESYPDIKDFCKLFKQETGIICYACHTHPVFDAAKKRQFYNKQCFWLGKITWTEA